jgi:4'-phosphopantetheinyl transferase
MIAGAAGNLRRCIFAGSQADFGNIQANGIAMDVPEIRTTSDASSVVHVCACSVTRYSRLLAGLFAWLSPEEQTRARRFLKEADRGRFVLGRAMVRGLCATHLGTEPATIKLGRTPVGKPYLASPIAAHGKGLDFNVSHSGDCVLIAWSGGQPVGIDVEFLDRNTTMSFKELSEAAFSDPERAALSAVAPDQIGPTFYRIWVRKEAVLKAEGCGVGGPLQSFSVVHERATDTEWLDRVHFPESGRTWRIIDLAPAADHVAALALPQGSIVHHCRPEDAGIL